MISRTHVVRDFFEEAEALRRSLDVRFKDPYAEGISWHYFCDPAMYAYLRAVPKKVFPAGVFDRFMRQLRSWCLDNLGLAPMNMPSLNLMVNGCKLGLHSDFQNGVWGYVYSLTRWDTRRFAGGETLLLKDGIPSYKRHHVQGDVLYDLIPAHFNQLLVFDDRIVHATPVIEGSMDPMEGRIAMVGHIRATSPVVNGALLESDARGVILEVLPALREGIRVQKEVQGTIAFRLVVRDSGEVESVTILTDNLIIPASAYTQSDAVATVRSTLQQAMSKLRFPRASGPSVVTAAILVPIPDLSPLELRASHGLTRKALCDWIEGHPHEWESLGLDGSWEGTTLHVRNPLAGRIRVDDREITIRFDPPMWVASQREKFIVAITDWTRKVVDAATQEV